MKYMNPHIKFHKEQGKSNSRKDSTEVTCVKCKVRFTLPFRPRKPEILCDDCFKKKKNNDTSPKGTPKPNTQNKKKYYIKH